MIGFKLFCEEHPPHLIGKFIDEHIEAFKKIVDKFSNLSNNFISLEEILGRSKLYEMEDYFNSLEKIKKKSEDIIYWLGTRDRKYEKNFINDKINEYLNSIEIDTVSEILNRWEENTKDDYDYWEDTWGTKEEVHKQINDLKSSLDLIARMKKWYPAYEKKIKAIKDVMDRRVAGQYTGKVDLPAHEKTETLYHATVSVSKLLKEGFKTRKELGDRGALGGGPNDLISFTSDPAIADSIVWVLRRAIEISNGKFNLANLIKLAKHFGTDPEEIIEFTRNSHRGIGRYTNYSDYGTKAKKFYPTEKERREWMFNAFRYLMVKQSKIYDPWLAFVNTDDFEKLDAKDVGIVAAEVDMSKVSEYLTSMEELRVPKDAILRVWRYPYKGVFGSYVQ